MALALGVNCGFVASAPVDDPGGSPIMIDTRAFVMKHTSPDGASVITEIGWWCDVVSEEANFEVGLYAADGPVVPGEAGTLLYSSVLNAKGTGIGWKRVMGLDWEIDPNTDYWIGVQLDDTANITGSDYASTGGAGMDYQTLDLLPDPWGGGAIGYPTRMMGFYAVYGVGGGGGVGKSFIM